MSKKELRKIEKQLSKEAKAKIITKINTHLKYATESCNNALIAANIVYNAEKKDFSKFNDKEKKLLFFNARIAFYESGRTCNEATEILNLKTKIEKSAINDLIEFDFNNLIKSDLNYIKRFVKSAYETSRNAIEESTQAALKADDIVSKITI